MNRLENVDMSEYTTFRCGGRAEEMLIPDTEQELASAIKELKESGKDFFILGNGSNVIVRDGGYPGTMVKLGKGFSEIEASGNILTCGAAAMVSMVAKTTVSLALAGFEFASGIPGTIGGAVFMNAGAYGGEMKDIVKSVRLLDTETLEIKDVPGSEMGFSYRHSKIQESGEIVISVTLELAPGDRKEIADEIAELTRKRNEKQQVMYPSAGSFFKRPEGYFAGKLIEDAGLKGLAVGGAQISEVHAGFMVNRGGATVRDIEDLMHLVQNKVMEEFGVKLEPEVRIIGN